MNFAKLAKECNVKYFGILSSEGVKTNSWFWAVRVKGEMEASISAL